MAVVDSGANLVAFQRMDGAQLASVQIAEHKARAAAAFRRETKVYEDAVQLKQNHYVLSIDGVIAARGGIPLIEAGKLIGAIGCSGGADPGRNSLQGGCGRHQRHQVEPCAGLPVNRITTPIITTADAHHSHAVTVSWPSVTPRNSATTGLTRV